MANVNDIAKGIVGDTVHRGNVVLSKEDAVAMAESYLSLHERLDRAEGFISACKAFHLDGGTQIWKVYDDGMWIIEEGKGSRYPSALAAFYSGDVPIGG